MVGHYQLQNIIVQGGIGVVYLAKDNRLTRTVAISPTKSIY
jgi:serine/threonine protein kinase